MASSNTTTAKFDVDISDLKKNIQDANRQIRLANAEFKAASAGMQDWSKTTDGVSAKIAQLDKNLKNQNTVLETYKKELELIVAEQGENSKGADEMRIKIANQQAAVNKTSAELDKYKGILAQLETEQANSANETGKQTEAYSKLQETINTQESDLDNLKKQYAAVVLEEGKNSESAQDLAKQIDSLSTELKDNKQKMEDADKAADDLDKSLDDTGETASDTADGFTIMKGALADLASNAIQSAIKALGDLAKAAAKAWEEFDDGRDNIIKMTGATGEAADRLMESYENVATSVNASFSDIGSAIGEVSTRFGVTGDELDDMASKFLKFADVNKADVTTSIDGVQKAMSAFGMDSSKTGDMLDALTYTAQNTGVKVDSLTSGLISNGTAFQEMGLSVEQSIKFMGMLEKSGANSETVLNGMRKALKNTATGGEDLSISLIALQHDIENGTDGIDGLTEAYEIFGKSGDQIYGAIKNGTIDFKNLATVAEDTGGTLERTFADTQSPIDKMRLSVQKARFQIAQAMEDFLQKYGPKLENMLESFVNDVLPDLLDFVGDIVDAIAWLTDNGEDLADILEGIAWGMGLWMGYNIAFQTYTGLMEILPALIGTVEGAQWGLNAAMDANPIGAIILLITALVEIIMHWDEIMQALDETLDVACESMQLWYNMINLGIEIWKNFWKTLLKNVKAGFEKIKAYFDSIVDYFREKVTTPIKNFFLSIWESIKTKAQESLNAIKSAWGTVKDWFENHITKPVQAAFDKMYNKLPDGANKAWEGIKQAFSKVGEWFSRIFADAWNKIKGVFNGAGDFFKSIKDGVSEGIKGTVNKIIQGLNKVIGTPFEAINAVIDKLANLTIGTSKPLADLTKHKIKIPQIPLLESGGILDRGQMGLLEGNGAEAVVPLENNKKWIAATAHTLKQALIDEGLIAGINGGSGLGGNVVNNYTFTQNNSSPKALDRLAIYQDTNNLLFNAKVRFGNV